MINEEIDKLLTDSGITPQFVIEQRKQVLTKALEKGDLTNANRTLDSFEDKLDMKPNEKKFQRIIEYDFGKHLTQAENEELSNGDNKLLPSGE